MALNDIYGARVGQIPLPDPFGDLSRVLPGLSGLNTAAQSSILSKLSGQLSPETQAMMRNYAAATSAKSGMPGSNAIPGTLGYNRSLRDIGRTTEDVQSEGVRQLLPFLQTTSATQTVNPALQYERNLQNAINTASPEPGAAGTHAEELFNKYLDLLTNQGPAGGTRRQVGPPQASFAPKPVASYTPPTGNRQTSGASSFSTDWTGRPTGANRFGGAGADLWQTPNWGPFGYSGPPVNTGTSGGTFYAGPNTDFFWDEGDADIPGAAWQGPPNNPWQGPPQMDEDFLAYLMGD